MADAAAGIKYNILKCLQTCDDVR